MTLEVEMRNSCFASISTACFSNSFILVYLFFPVYSLLPILFLPIHFPSVPTSLLPNTLCPFLNLSQTDFPPRSLL